jgi:hypothetical protein
VICGRGKAATDSPGNKKLRDFVETLARPYAVALTKEQKSHIVTTVISLVDEADGGAFVKFEEGTWWKVDETYAREKVGYLFRDILHAQYRSSTKAKQAKKQKASSSRPRSLHPYHDEIKKIASKLKSKHSLWSLGNDSRMLSSSDTSSGINMNSRIRETIGCDGGTVTNDDDEESIATINEEDFPFFDRLTEIFDDYSNIFD